MKQQILLGLFLLTILCAAPVFAQEESADKEKLVTEFIKLKKTLFPYSENQCETYGKAEFFGGELNLNIENADVQDILNVITEQYGCRFVIEKSVVKVPITVKAKSSWNVVLCSILQSQNLAVKVDGSILRIIEAENPESLICGSPEQNGLSNTPLYTEFVKLENLKIKVICCEMATRIDEDSQKFVKMVWILLFSRGAIEVESRSNTLIITDGKDRIKLISDFVKLLDESGITLEEIVNDPNLQIK